MSVITNKTNQPHFLELMAAEKNNSHKRMGEDEFSVTMLKRSVTAMVLYRRYYDTIEVDLQDIADSLMGTLTHEGLEFYAIRDGYLVEQELSLDVPDEQGSFKLYGKLDMYRPADGSLIDFKNTKEAMYNKSLAGDEDEWKYQLTMYALMLKSIMPQWYTGLTSMGIEAYLKDLSVVSNAVKGISTDKLRYLGFDVPTDEEMKEALDYCIESVRQYNQYKDKPDEELPFCSDEYRWATKVWKIYKGTKDNHNKTAERGHAKYESLEDAEKGFKAAGFKDSTHCIVEVGGESIRCKYFCDCKSVCPYAKKMFGGKNETVES